MSLTLTVLRCPDRVTPEVKRLEGGELVIGRGPGAQWTLTDPSDQPKISRRHCTVFFAGGGWKITDQSTNGTFLNRDAEPVGPAGRDLRNGDRLRIGPYEIEVGITEATSAGFGGGFGGGIGYDPFGPQSAPPSSLFGPDPFAAAPPVSPFGAEAGHSDHGLDGPAFGPPSVRLPDDFANELFNSDPSSPPRQATQSDHTPAFSDVMPMPQPRTMLPTDWDEPLAPPPAPVAPPPFTAPPAAQPRPGPIGDPFAEPAAAPPPGGSPFGADPFGEAQARTTGTPFREPDTQPAAPVMQAPPQSATVQPAPAQPRPQSAPDDSGLLTAFLRGAQLEDAQLADPAAAMERAGAAFRAFVTGLREVLIARAEVKSAFRIDQTMVRARGNNPLKFAAGDDDAMAAMLGAGRRTEMSAAAAVTESLNDIRLHELASMAAMQEAVRDLLGKLDPAKFRAASEGGIGLPAQKRARAFEMFEADYGKLREQLADRFDDVFGRAFAEAYERVTAELQARGSKS